jgi:hypothetical protein
MELGNNGYNYNYKRSSKEHREMSEAEARILAFIYTILMALLIIIPLILINK